jgi:transcriptional regulator GlxA family with amidase domain
MSGKPLYRWSLASSDGASAVCSNGSITLVDRGLEPLERQARLFVLSGLNVRQHVSPALLGYIRRERRRGVAVGGLCSGAYVLAKAGLLNDVETAIHWEFHDSFMEEFPEVGLCRKVFVADERIVTASGGTATADLMLHLIGSAHGADLARAVADQMVYHSYRDSSVEQRVFLPGHGKVMSRHLSRAIQMMADSIDTPLSTAEIAEEIGISTRQLERLFARHLNCTPKKYFVDMRLQRAQNLLNQTDRTITEVTYACGFSSPSYFARVFKSQFGITPMTQRARIA